MEEQIDTQKTKEQKNFRNNTTIKNRKIFISTWYTKFYHLMHLIYELK